MLRLVGFLAVLCVGVGGFLTVDYTLARKKALAEEEIALSVSAYFGNLYTRVSAISAASGTPATPSVLVDMLPKPPEGWTVRPTVSGDEAAFLPEDRGDGDPQAVRLVRDTVRQKFRGADDVVALTYERGERRVVVVAIRYPDRAFVDPASHALKYELQTTGAAFRGIDAMTVRGLDITEDILPDGLPARMFVANVGGQIHLRVLASKRMKDADLVPFFETLNVAAMNAQVVDRQEGLGEVPVIVVAAALSDEDRETYVAARTARESEATARAAEARDLAAAEVMTARLASGEEGALAEPEAPADAATCVKGEGGLKRCKVAP